MTEEELQNRLNTLEIKVDAVYRSAEKTRKYLLYTLIGSILVIVLPMIGLMFVIPSFMSTYSSLGAAYGLQ